jgi:DNA-binding CsgD family transcriptional regulator
LSTTEQVDADVERSLQLAKRCEDASAHVHVLQFAGAALLHSRSIDAGYHLFQQGVEVCEANDLAFHLPAAHGGASAWLAWSGRLDQTRRHARRAVELSRQLGRPGWEAAGLTGLAAAAVLQGDHIRAREWLSEARAALRPRALEGTHYGMWARHWAALSAYAAGDLDAARVTAEEIVRIGRAGGSRLDEAMGEWLLGLVARSQVHHDDARAHLDAARALSTDPRLPHTLGRSSLGLADLAWEDEDIETGWELAHDSLEVLNDYGDRVGASAALEAIAGMALARGEPERSLRLLAASQRFHTDAGIVRFPSQSDRFDRARDAARAALNPTDATACWEAGGERPLADAVAYALRGRGERQRPQTGWASLTPVERDVVGLVAQGRTNAEIGQRLFISVNTVKKHLSHVYAKVDVAGRADLAAEVARRDL